jgi:hypothetical protein
MKEYENAANEFIRGMQVNADEMKEGGEVEIGKMFY